MSTIQRSIFEQVHADWMCEGGRIEEDDIVHSMLRDEVEKPLRKIAVRIKKRAASALSDRRDEEPFQERCLSSASLAQYVHVPQEIVFANTKHTATITSVVERSEGKDGVRGHGVEETVRRMVVTVMDIRGRGTVRVAT